MQDEETSCTRIHISAINSARITASFLANVQRLPSNLLRSGSYKTLLLPVCVAFHFLSGHISFAVIRLLRTFQQISTDFNRGKNYGKLHTCHKLLQMFSS